MGDAAFQRDRLQAALGKLRERLARLKDQEENTRRQLAYNKAEAVRDELANELADLYPAFAQKLVELLARVVVNDREIEYINEALPSGADRLLVAELKARGLPGWVVNSVEAPRITYQLCLPPWQPELSPKVGDGGNREGGISWGCLTPPLLHQRSDMPCPTITSPD
jgi:hypothetical protein